jgi:hypothetical protein
MSTDADFSYLENFPTQFFSSLLGEWSGEEPDYNFKPNGLLSPENRELTVKLAQSISSSRQKQLLKLSKFLDISDVWWTPYHIPKTKPISNLLKIEKSILDVNKYTPDASAKIKGNVFVHELSEHAILIIIEFQSRSRLLRRVFRQLFLPSAKIILVEPQDQAMEILTNELLPFMTGDPKQLTQKRANARFIRKLTKSPEEDRLPLTLTYLKIRISLETSGIEGLNHITIQGTDVIRGAETLEQRHEISLKFMNSGPWVGAGTEDFIFEVGKGVQILKLEKPSLKSLATVLTGI